MEFKTFLTKCHNMYNIYKKGNDPIADESKGVVSLKEITEYRIAEII